MKQILLANLGWKLLSVLLAFLLWVALAREPEMTTSVTVPILFLNLPDDLDIHSDVPDRVQLDIRGPAGRLTPSSLAQAAVVLNLSNLQAAERTFTIRDTNVRGLPAGVLFYRCLPSQVHLTFQHLLSKQVLIEPVYEKPAPAGYKVAAFSFDPSKVTIRGPEAKVRNVERLSTDPIDLSQVVGRADKEVHVRLPDPQMQMESKSRVTFRVTVEKVSNKAAN